MHKTRTFILQDLRKLDTYTGNGLMLTWRGQVAMPLQIWAADFSDSLIELGKVGEKWRLTVSLEKVAQTPEELEEKHGNQPW